MRENERRIASARIWLLFVPFTLVMACSTVAHAMDDGLRIALVPDKKEHNAEPTREYRALADKAINPFGLEMYSKLKREDENFIFSPFSVFLPLAIAYEGARGQTRDEISKVLGIGAATVPLDTVLSGLALELVDSARQHGGALLLANGVWAEKFPHHVIRESFRKTVTQTYGADIREADFRTSPGKVAKEINDWIKETTDGKITDLISAEELVKEQTVLAIVNAIYFKNVWAWPFNAALTHDEDFIGAGGSRTKVPMMHISQNFPYMEEESFQAIAVPYKGWQTSMVIFLPKKVDGLQEFEKSLTAEKLTALLRKFAHWPGGLRVTFPKFTSRSRCPLAPTLQEMGMKTAFGPRADFSGIREKKRSKTPDNLLFITSVLHEAWIDVNEKGTEAGAATKLGATPKAKPIHEPKIFRADHPFMFIIRHNPTNCILFVGRVTNPAGNKSAPSQR